jgi:hypothetical protein
MATPGGLAASRAASAAGGSGSGGGGGGSGGGGGGGGGDAAAAFAHLERAPGALPLRRARTRPTEFHKRWVPLCDWPWAYRVTDGVAAAAARAPLSVRALPCPRYSVDVRGGLTPVGAAAAASASGSVAKPVGVPHGVELQALGVLLAGLQGFCVEGVLTTPMGQRLRHPAAVLQFLTLQAGIQVQQGVAAAPAVLPPMPLAGGSGGSGGSGGGAAGASSAGAAGAAVGVAASPR